MKVEVIAKDTEINEILGLRPTPYKQCISQAFKKIEQNEIISSWKDSIVSGILEFKISDYIKVPEFGCYKNVHTKQVSDVRSCIEKIRRIGGKTGWY